MREAAESVRDRRGDPGGSRQQQQRRAGRRRRLDRSGPRRRHRRGGAEHRGGGRSRCSSVIVGDDAELVTIITGQDADRATDRCAARLARRSPRRRRGRGAPRRSAALPVPVRGRVTALTAAANSPASTSVGSRASATRSAASLARDRCRDLLDLLTYYPRRWVDRSNEARIADLVPGRRGARARHGALGDQARHAQPAHDGDGQRRRRFGADGGGLLQPAVARAPAARGAADRAVRQGRRVSRRAADDEPGRRPHRRPHRPDRADLPAEREGPDQHLGDRRMGRGGTAPLP